METKNIELMNIEACKAITNPELREDTFNLISLYQSNADNGKQICRILWHVLDKKLYETAGFKSLNAYAEAINIPDKSRAFKLAETGKVLAHFDKKIATNKATDKEKEFAENATATALHKLAKANLTNLDQAINDGTVKPDIKVEEADNWAHANLNEEAQKRADKKPGKLIKRYALQGYIYHSTGVSEVKYDDCIPEEVEEFNGFSFAKVKCVEDTVYIGYNPESCAMARYTITTPIAKKETKKPKFTKEQLLEMLKALEE